MIRVSNFPFWKSSQSVWRLSRKRVDSLFARDKEPHSETILPRTSTTFKRLYYRDRLTRYHIINRRHAWEPGEPPPWPLKIDVVRKQRFQNAGHWCCCDHGSAECWYRCCAGVARVVDEKAFKTFDKQVVSLSSGVVALVIIQVLCCCGVAGCCVGQVLLR